jgi:hypothetical protein
MYINIKALLLCITVAATAAFVPPYPIVTRTAVKQSRLEVAAKDALVRPNE